MVEGEGNPRSQSFSENFGSTLPTSPAYLDLLTTGPQPSRPVAVIGTTRGVNKYILSQNFGSILPTSTAYFDLLTTGPQPSRHVGVIGTTSGVNNFVFLIFKDSWKPLEHL